MQQLKAAPRATLVRRPRPAPRIGLLASDPAVLHVVADRCRRLEWDFYRLTTVDVREICELRLSAMVVDLEMLGFDTWRFLEQLGREAPQVALVVCSARSSVAERVRGLHLGADDWLTKPVHPDELVARIEAILRRRSEATARILATPERAGELEIRPDRFQVFVAGRSADLTRREFELLRMLSGASGKVLEREEIYQQVWGFRMARGDRSVDVFIRKLRQKLGRVSPRWTYIHTHLGIGYRFQAELEALGSELTSS
jgi:DNA-binding response OmpR family regulator